jgi:hypothetical protein
MRHSIDPRNIEAIDDDLAAVLRMKSPAERLRMVGEANDTARILAAAGIRYLHPDWCEDQICREVARRMLSAAD